jgi:hypothetical protein
MRALRQSVLLAGLLLASPALGAELQIPALHQSPVKASFPWAPAAAPAVISPRLPSKRVIPATITPAPNSMAKEPAAPALVPEPIEPETSHKDSQPGPPSAEPTWLERFGPFLRSQLDMIVTGSIAPPGSRCDFGKKQTSRSHCGPARSKRAKSAKRSSPQLPPVAPLE